MRGTLGPDGQSALRQCPRDRVQAPAARPLRLLCNGRSCSVASASSPNLVSAHSDLLSLTDRCIAFDYTVVNSYSLLVKDIVYSRSAVKILARMPRNHAGRVRNKIQAYARNPNSQVNNIACLQERDNLLRLRVGDSRVVMHDADALEILHIARRGSVYKE